MLFSNEVINKESFTYRNRHFENFTSPEILDKVCQFQYLPTDIIVATNQRSGTTFTQEIIWQIKNIKSDKPNENNDVAFTRVPFIECNYKLFQGIPECPIELLRSRKDDPYRLIKTHLPYEFIKDNVEKTNPKMIVVMRNMKDCLVSNYFFHLNSPIIPYRGTFDDFFKSFINEKTSYGNYFDNNVEWWALRDRENVLILFYEDILMNLSENVEKISKFLGDKLTQDEIDKISENCSFASMFKNPTVNFKFNDSFTFLRKGIVGDWKSHLTEEQNAIMDEIISSKYDKVGLKFIYE